MRTPPVPLRLAAIAITILLGLASRRWPEHQPAFVAEYAGDTLWGLFWFLLARLALPGRPLWQAAALALAVTFGIEFSQLCRAPWLDHLRQTRAGGLLLGHTFLWSDLACCVIGVSTGWGLAILGRSLKRTSNNETRANRN